MAAAVRPFSVAFVTAEEISAIWRSMLATMLA
jgi:hypothetical protein